MIPVRALSAVACLLAGCAQISGLNDLGVCDGSTCDDATITADSATVDAIAPSDASPRDVYVDISCTRPLDCSDGGVVATLDAATTTCCELFTTTGKPPSCDITSDITQCRTPSACPTSFPQDKCGPAVVRRCTSNSDCSEPIYTHCCSIPDRDATIQICASSLIAMSLSGSCM